MKNQEAIQFGLDLVNRSEIVMLGSVSEDGFPHIRAMLKMECEGLKNFLLSTNTSSNKVNQLFQNSKASLYFVDEQKYIGLLLLGTVEILQDPVTRQKLWREGFEMYYPLGVDDPNYSILSFTSQKGILYYDLSITKFEL